MLSPNDRALYVADHGAHRVRHVVVNATAVRAPSDFAQDALDPTALDCLEAVGGAASTSPLHFRVR